MRNRTLLRSDDRFRFVKADNSLRAAEEATRRHPKGIDAWRDVPPEFTDVVACALRGDRILPDVLPADLEGWSVERIERRLESHLGEPASEIDRQFAHLRFTAPGESVARIIHDDARTLRELGVSRHRLAERLDAAFAIGECPRLMPLALSPSQSKELADSVREWLRRLPERMAHLGARPGPDGKVEESPVDVGYCITGGTEHDPFHPSFSLETRGVADVRGSCDATITNRRTGEAIQTGDMLPYLIRTACFFEGRVEYRLDPAAACRVLDCG